MDDVSIEGLFIAESVDASEAAEERKCVPCLPLECFPRRRGGSAQIYA